MNGRIESCERILNQGLKVAISLHEKRAYSRAGHSICRANKYIRTHHTRMKTERQARKQAQSPSSRLRTSSTPSKYPQHSWPPAKLCRTRRAFTMSPDATTAERSHESTHLGEDHGGVRLDGPVSPAPAVDPERLAPPLGLSRGAGHLLCRPPLALEPGLGRRPAHFLVRLAGEPPVGIGHAHALVQDQKVASLLALSLYRSFYGLREGEGFTGLRMQSRA